LASRSSHGFTAFAIAALSTLLWWAIDAVDQSVPWWMWLVGIAMLSVGMLAGGVLLVIACWIVYWTKVRE
jgi:hypothetical protein